MDPAVGRNNALKIETSASCSAQARPGKGGGIAPYFILTLLAAGLFAIRVASPPNLLDQDQERPASYVLDAVQNGHWIFQRDWTGDISSKPPVWTWLSALTTLACGRITVFSLYLPGALGIFGAACLIYGAGRVYLGARAAFFGALALLMTEGGMKAFGLARTDGVFALTVTAGALLAWRAWLTGRGWTWFWLAAAASTLTKGPLGLVLSVGGLLAVPWERESGAALPLRGSHLAGIILFLALILAWLCLAYSQFGHSLGQKLFGRELIGHAVSDGNHVYPGMHFYQPPLYYLARAAPWSLLAVFGLWRVWKTPALEIDGRRFERFLFCWFFAGLAIFCLSPNQRSDHLWPIFPAGALLAGRELQWLTRNFRSTAVQAWAVVLTVLFAGGYAYYYFGLRTHTTMIKGSVALRQVAAEIEGRGGVQFPITHVDDPMTLQIWLNTLRPPVSVQRAAALLRGPEAAFVAVDDLAALQSARLPTDPPLYTLLPDPPNSDCPTRIIGNVPKLEQTNAFAFCFGPLLVRAHQLRLLGVAENEVRVTYSGRLPSLTLVNDSRQPCSAAFSAVNGDVIVHKARPLAPGEVWNALP